MKTRSGMLTRQEFSYEVASEDCRRIFGAHMTLRVLSLRKSSSHENMRCECETAEFSGRVCSTFRTSSERRVRLSASRPDLVLSTSLSSRSRPNNLEPYSYKPRSVQSYSDCLRASIDRRVCVNSSILAIVIARMRYLYLHIIFIFIYNIYLYVLLFTASKICPSKCTVGYNPDRSYTDARTQCTTNPCTLAPSLGCGVAPLFCISLFSQVTRWASRPPSLPERMQP